MHQNIVSLFQSLTTFILNHSVPCFLLEEVVKRLDGHTAEGLPVSIIDYEYYLKHHSKLSIQEQRLVRQKIMGRSAPRECAQLIFPVAAGGQLPGSLVVTAHMSPDIDTVVTSFNGWMDAFEMDVATGLHRWNVPNDPKEILEVKLLFLERFGPNFFSILSDNRTHLTVTALDLATMAGVEELTLADRTLDISYDGVMRAVCVVDEKERICGTWLAEDVEPVRFVIDGLNHAIRWMQNAFFGTMVAKEAKGKALLEKPIRALEPVEEMSSRQKKQLDIYLKKVLEVSHGIESSVQQFMEALENRFSFGFSAFLKAFAQHKNGTIEDLEQLFHLLSNAFRDLRHHVDTFRVALQVKEHVLGEKPMFVHPHTTFEEIQLRLQERSALFVVRDRHVEGVIYASKMRANTHGFIALRDFSNPNEIGIPRYMEIASVLDHHKSELKTHRISTVHIMDVQSSNVIGAKISFDINRRLISDGPTDQQLEDLLHENMKRLNDGVSLRVMERALEETTARWMKEGWCAAGREGYDYRMFLYAILDDTDLLAKKTALDHEIVVELVNRLVSLERKTIVEVIDPLDEKSLIQHPELYRFYQTVYSLKEQDVNRRLESGKIFHDTKKQAGALVSQIKIYPNNVTMFHAQQKKLAELWYNNPTDLSLKLMMVTTVEGAEDLFKGIKSKHQHRDELWVAAESNDEGRAQLAYFLTTFFALHAKKEFAIFLPEGLKGLCNDVLGGWECTPHSLPWMVLRFPPGTIASRKKDIAPCLKQ